MLTKMAGFLSWNKKKMLCFWIFFSYFAVHFLFSSPFSKSIAQRSRLLCLQLFISAPNLLFSLSGRRRVNVQSWGTYGHLSFDLWGCSVEGWCPLLTGAGWGGEEWVLELEWGRGERSLSPTLHMNIFRWFVMPCESALIIGQLRAVGHSGDLRNGDS